MIALRPSGSHRWSKCAAEPTFSASAPKQPDSDAAKEGTCAAWVAETVLVGDASHCNDMVGKVHTNGWEVDQDMAIRVQDYCEHVASRGNVLAEHQVTFSANIKGTLDSAFHAWTEQILYVTDYKDGYLPVEVFENPQLIIYAWSLLQTLSVGSVKLIQLEIYQPRAFHHDGIVRKWVVTVEELEREADDLIRASIKCGLPNPLATPGSHCTYCPAAMGCEALAHTTYTMAHTIMSPHYRDMDVNELSRELNFLDDCESVIKARFKAVTSEALARSAKKAIPGWQMTARTGHRQFKVNAAAVKVFTGIDASEQKMITPAEAIRRGADKKVIESLSEKTKLGHKLTRVTRKKVAQIFSRKEL